MKKWVNVFVLLTSFSIANAQVDVSLQKEIEHSVINGLKYLASVQEDDGSWQHHPAITGLVLSSFLRAHPSIGIKDTTIKKGIDFLTKLVQTDGGIYADDMKTYTTAICVMTFEDLGVAEYSDIILNGKKFLMSMQMDEELGLTVDSIYYGGLSYGKMDKAPDLSNLQWALEAISYESQDLDRADALQTKVDPEQKKIFFDKAITFLERTQNYKTNDQAYASNDGGFMYRPGESKAGETISYGGMTYAGLKSMIFAKVSKDDERVQAAFNWIKNNYSVEENPGMGLQGLYYYYQTMAKALSVMGIEELNTPKGEANWRSDLADQLIKIQNSDGSWVNSNGRWWENNPVLVTAYSLLALETIAGLPHNISTQKTLRIE
ncbi:MAG: terpene cyclase/mutase family protein [Melioribacteraceae bacterium]|nr:terpene cyclase/mutase family protein [Melioribacteraceae bacterium]WKZ70813.1 MAG: terpene cyclase/mutase family protein [Melioribacteraceae bacterium]